MAAVVLAVTAVVCKNRLKEQPANLLIAKAPKAGKKIFLERIGFFWKHLSFKYKSSKGSISFTYDKDGRVVKQSNGLEFIYDQSGIAGIKYNNATYFYRKDAQGNISAILDSNGNIVVEYKYDSWGNHAVLDANGADINDASHIGNLNPFRYRGYYYDTETGLYFLKTRYYDPEVGRFITIDDISYIDPETINGLNLYAYCGNNPVMRVDENGNSWWDNLWKVIVGVVVIGALVAGSVLTAGTLSVVLAGAAIGAIGGALGSVVSTAVTGDWGNFGNNFLVGIGAGAISGAISATGLGIGWQIGANALIGLGNYAVSTKINGGKITIGGLISSAVFGGFAGAIGGAGMMNGNSLANAFVGFNGKNFFATLGANVGKELFKSLLKQSVSYIIIGGLLNGLYSRFLQNKFNPKNNFWGW